MSVWRQAAMLLLLLGAATAPLAAVVGGGGGKVEKEAKRQIEGAGSNSAAGKRAVLLSELKLRSMVEQSNVDLRELKRTFMRQMTDVYLRLKLDPSIGFEQARGPGRAAAGANLLLAEELATVVIKKHIVQRRLLAGLKLAFVKLLPMQTLVSLYQRFDSFAWLRDQQQLELGPKFAGATEEHFVALYALIESRAKARAADDVLALCSPQVRRSLQVVQWYLVESNHGAEVSGPELEALARNSKTALQFYQRELLDWRRQLHEQYSSQLAAAQPLAQMLAGSELELVQFVDRLIDLEALDIELSQAAGALDFPPTINEQMVNNVQKRWIPWYVLKSVEEDRALLIEKRESLMQLVRLEEDKLALGLDEWLGDLLDYVCHNEVVYLHGP